MRQLFSSARIENVEAVARMLEEAGIQVRISHGRSYRGAIRGNFSYREGTGGRPQPAVWVVRSDQQPEARRLLREAGLLQETTVRGESFLPSPVPVAGGDRGLLAARGGGGRFRLGLLLAVAVMVALVMVAYRASRSDAPADGVSPVSAAPAPPQAPRGATPAAGVPMLTGLPEEAFEVATPPALAATLLRAELAAAGARAGCLGVDGADPDAALLAELAAAGVDVAPASACPRGRLAVRVAGYTTDGSGSGSVRVAVAGAPERVLEVRREGRDWQVTGTR